MALTDWALSFIVAALEVSTQSSYASGVKAYDQFCDSHGITADDKWPPSPETLMGFATHLRRVRKVRSETVRNYVSAVRSLCVDIGASTDSFYNPTLVRLLEGMRRLEKDDNQTPRSPRLPITVSLLNKMIPEMPSSIEGTMIKACASCGVYGLMRSGEMSYKGKRYHILRRSDVTWHANSLEIRLRNSKTDYLRQGVTIRLSANGSASCPFRLLRNAWNRATNQCLDAALFQTQSGGPLHYKTLLLAIKRSIAALGITGNYGGHSLRAGGATTLALMGYPDSLIKILGRWKSLSYQRYIQLDPNTFRDVSVDMAKQGKRAQPFGGLPGRSPICLFLDNLDVSLRMSNP